MTNRRTQALLVAYRASSEMASKVAFFLVTLAAARRLTANEFGIFSLGTTIGWMAAVAADFGIQLHLARAVAQQPDQARPLLRRWLRVRVLTSGLAFAAIAAGAVLVDSAAAGIRDILILTAVYLVSGLIEFLHYFYRGLSRTDIESSLTLVQRAGTLVLGVGALMWRPSLTLLGAALLVPVVLTLAFSAMRAARLAAEASAGQPETHHDTQAPATASVLPIGLGIVLSALYFRIDLFLVDAWSGTAAAGLYNAAFRLVEALRLFPAAVLAVGLPVIFRATSRGPLAEIGGALLVGSCLVSVALAVVAEPVIVLLFGETFAAAVPAFRILLLGFPLMSVNYALTHQLIGWHEHRAYAAICAAALIFNLTVNAQLIPSRGIEGAAWTTVWTEVLLTAACIATLARRRVLTRAADHDAIGRIEPVNGALSS